MSIAIAIKDLKKVYANGFEALKGISLEVVQGDFFALLGPNGAGKSILVSRSVGITCTCYFVILMITCLLFIS